VNESAQRVITALERSYQPYRESARLVTDLSLQAIAAVADGRDRLPVDFSDQDYNGSLVPDTFYDPTLDDLNDALWAPLSNLNDGNKDVWGPFATFVGREQIVDLDLAAIRTAYATWSPPTWATALLNLTP
jgi:hypothetical protein